MERVFDAVVVGGGIVGLWAALDLGLRGARVLLVERGWLGSGTSSRFHGLLHSGARYVVRDPVSARECAVESRVLRRVMPHAIRDTGGFFVAVTGEDERFYDTWAEAMRRVGIPFRELAPGEALREEPMLNPRSRLVIEVPDGVIYAEESLSSLAAAAWLDAGAVLATWLEAVGFEKTRQGVMVRLRDRLRGGLAEAEARVIVNAAGPWAPRVASLAGLSLEMNPVGGTILVYGHALLTRVVNRLRPPSDGDILVPYGSVLLAGTTAFPAKGPTVEPRRGDEKLLAREAAVLAPRLRSMKPSRVFASVRPLAAPGGGREATRSFRIIVHRELPGFISIVGGKYTTARLVAEHAAAAAARILGIHGSGSVTESYRVPGKPLELLRDVAPAKARELEESTTGMDWERLEAASYRMLAEAAAEAGRRQLGLSA